ncbi:unnamed protein product [Closterium sp. NIES-53]
MPRFHPTPQQGMRMEGRKYNHLRPEAVEAWMYLWRATHDPIYRQWGWEVFQAFQKHCRVENGFVGLLDASQNPPQQDDLQHSFFLAETLKYLYLLFSPDDVLPLNQWVFNTEAHPLKIIARNSDFPPRLRIESQTKRRRHLEHDVDADSSAVPVWQPITWSPENDKYLLATCTHGHVADRVVCLQRYVLVAAMLNRTLVVPENDLCGDARHHANHLDATSTLSGIRSIGSDSRTSNRRHRDFGPPSVSFSRVLNLAKLEQCFSSGNSGSIASSSSSSGGQNAGSGTSSAVEDGRANFARRLSNVPLSDTSENSGGDSGGDSGGNSGGNDERAIMPRVMTLTRFLRLRRMKTVHVDSLVCGHSPGSCSLPSHCASSHRELRENKLYETEVTRVALPRRTDRMSPFASSISDFPRAILTDAPRSYRVSVLSLGDLSNLNASDLLIGADVPYHLWR